MKRIFRTINQSKLLSLCLRLSLTVFALWLVFKDIDLAHLGDMFSNQDHFLVVLVPLIVIIQTALVAFRWRHILTSISDGTIPLLSGKKIFTLNYISSFFNCCLPGTVGADLVRVWLAKAESLPVSTSIHSVIIDRLIALLALVLLSVITLPFIDDAIGFQAEWLSPILLTLCVVGIWILPHIDRKLSQFQEWRPVRWALYFSNSLCMMLKHRRASMVAIGYSIVSHAGFCLSVYILAASLNLEMTLMQSLSLVPPVMLLMTLPISFGGWGVREASMVGMLGLVGIPQASSLLISVEIGILTIIATLPGGVLWLIYSAKGNTIKPLAANAGEAS